MFLWRGICSDIPWRVSQKSGLPPMFLSFWADLRAIGAPTVNGRKVINRPKWYLRCYPPVIV